MKRSFTYGGLAALLMAMLAMVSTTAQAQSAPGFPQNKAAMLACLGEGEVRVTIAGQSLCVRPVVGMTREEALKAPRCSATQTLVRSSKGLLHCYDGTLSAKAEPVCLNGSTPLRLSDGSFACRRSASDGGLPDLKLSVREIDACTAGISGSRGCSAAPPGPLADQAARVDIVVTNIGTRDAPETDLIFGFPPNAPFRSHFAFRDPRQGCPAGSVLAGPSATCFLGDVGVFATPSSSSLNLTAKVRVPRLSPGALFKAFVLVERKTKMAQFPKTDLVDKTQIFARVNDGHVFAESDFGNSETVVTINFR